ncbi:MAG TPA: ribonuclease III [Bacteroidota bacterium]|nr:ribonuclease III [Bacteroidota bacterium]
MLTHVWRRFTSRLSLQLFCFFQDARVTKLVKHLRASGVDFAKFEEAIQYHPRNWNVFLKALMHRSYLQFLEETWDSNERLEFLGDAILNFIVAEYLFEKYPDHEEGYLTKVRSRLVNRKALAQQAREIHLSEFLLLSSSAAQSIDSGSESILADAFEAVIGAMYLDGGLKTARTFIRAQLLTNDEVFQCALLDDNYKSGLLEYAQAHSFGIPRYMVVREEGPEHDRRFTVEVLVNMQTLGTGTGRNKKEAEQAAAAQAMERLQKDAALIHVENGNAEAK